MEALGQIPDLDGIHLDYIRFPDVILAEGYNPTTASFRIKNTLNMIMVTAPPA
ncbi:MAG: hypothetical protein IPN20_03725 [Haliscomenobacter sp.]|nr:hypothetical protein [Haliscomenobacter sp.]